MPGRRPIPVLFVHHRSELGGAPESLSYLIRELDRDLFEPHVYCPPGPAADLFREAGATVHTGAVAGFTHIWASTYRGRRWLLFARELVRLPAHARQFRRTLRSERFALVHFNDSPLIPAAWLARREGLPVVWHLRSALPGGGTDRRSAFVRAAIKRLATTPIAINHDVAEVFDVGSAVVPNSVDLDRFRPGDRAEAKAAVGLPADLPVVSFFGFIYPSKGFREFIEAAARLREQGVEASYLIVGGAVRGEEFFRTVVGRSLQLADLTRDYESEAKKLVDELDLWDVVRFIPFTQDTAELYRASDVVVAPSQGPELGRPVIEAAASGVPVVASGSRTGGGVVVPGETGVLVDNFGVETLADAVATLLDDSENRKRLGRTARAHAEENFDPAKNARRIEGIYRRIAPQRERIPVLYVHHRPARAGEGRDRRSRAIAAMMERWGDAAIAIDRDVAARFPIRLPLTIVHNSVEQPVSRNGAGKSSLGLPSDRVAIGFAGFVRRQKGWPELVEAAEILVGEGAPAHFVIMGGGVRPPEYFRTLRGRALEATNLLTDEESAIKELVSAKDLDTNFSFLPFTAETGEIYSALDVVTFPNQGVGLGRPVLEAATYGKPVVASGSGDGAGVLLSGVTGTLLDDASPAALADALRTLIGDPDLRARLGSAAVAHARERFDPV